MKASPNPSPKSPESTPSTAESLSESLKKVQTTMETSLTQTTKELTDTLKSLNGGSHAVTKRTRGVLANWEQVIGGREALCEVFSLATLDLKQQHLLRLLENPENDSKSLAQIVKLAGMTATQVVELYKVAAQAMNHSLVSGQISQALPEVVQDMVEKSVDAWVECPECRGTGEGGMDLEGNQGLMCMRCRGKKVIFRPSDLDRQKIILEAGGVTKKGSGMTINMQQNSVSMPAANFSKQMKITDNAAYEAAEEDLKAIEGEVED